MANNFPVGRWVGVATWSTRLGFGLTFCVAFLVGCESSTPPPMETQGPDATSPADPISDAAAERARIEYAFLHQPFDRAVRFGEHAPMGTTRPPDVTIAGKSVGRLFSQVQDGWDSICFIDAAHRKLEYTALIATDLGEMEIRLLPDLAPNHVRSFIALVQVGYYDGLSFETRETDFAEEDPARGVAGGSPRGDADDMGGIGYWLPPEILLPEEAAKRGIKHEPGMVGLRHGVRADTGAGRFYICLTNAPRWDGEFTLFGKLIRGLDAAEKIYDRPVQTDLGDPRAFSKPVLIQRITISVQPLEK